MQIAASGHSSALSGLKRMKRSGTETRPSRSGQTVTRGASRSVHLHTHHTGYRKTPTSPIEVRCVKWSHMHFILEAGWE
ncbi:hypothetical protein E2C01_101435 [Portunus trituberculatus]|uniref:Uncharacterized protein n=1 Tax=Portunus trituberculatus TaxID=210409 RepID=A0A5B7KG36_PORTR|nr:hypothetical protein [Portunus trituberculatus]